MAGYTRPMVLRPIDLVDVLVYLVVLGLFVQFFPQVISESFVLTLLTAILLKVVLELVMVAKKRVMGAIKAAQRPVGRVIGAVALVLVMAGSKFLVLELTALAFGDSVQLGGFFLVTALILALILARAGMRRLLIPDNPETAKA